MRSPEGVVQVIGCGRRPYREYVRGGTILDRDALLIMNPIASPTTEP